jgi:hypothetical protein
MVGQTTMEDFWTSNETGEANNNEQRTNTDSVSAEDLEGVEIEGAQDEEEAGVEERGRAAAWSRDEGIIRFEEEQEEEEQEENKTGFDMKAYKQELNAIVEPVLPNDRMEKLRV